MAAAAGRLSTVDLERLRAFQPTKSTRLVRSCSYPTTQNIVCNIFFGTRINLEYLASQTPLSLSKPSFSAGTVRFLSTSIQTFGSGNCTSLGGSSVYEILWGAHTLRFILRQAGIDARQDRPIFCNHVCSGSVGHAIDIKNFERHDSIGTVAQDDAFPGIVYFITSPRTGEQIMFLVFNTGKFIVMGLSKDGDEEAQEAFDLILPTLERNRSDESAPSNHISGSLKRLRTAIQNKFDIIKASAKNPEEMMHHLNAIAKEEMSITATPRKRKRTNTKR